MTFLLKVFWFGKWRTRKPHKPRFYNRIQWFRDEGASLEKAHKALRLEKMEELRRRLNERGIHGKKRQNILNSKRSKIKRAVASHL